ncbi:MAG TPA: Hint domain-containing protein [Anaerolineales bacterium]|nr:Hint domain-containing protein [Anaerolineales bacterium]
MKKLTSLIAVLTVFLTACTPTVPQSGVSTPIEITAIVSTVIAETPGPPPTEGPSPTPVPATVIPTLPSSRLSPTELKYKILNQFPDFFFCDPDYYPIAHEDEMALAKQRFPELQANQEELEAILSHNGLSGLTTFTDDQKLFIYREHKKLNAIYFELAGDKFKFQIQTGSEGQQGSFINGTIDGNGSIEAQTQEPSFPACPICLAIGTLIDTPQGFVAVENLRVGDSVWTLNALRERIQAPILKTTRVLVPMKHKMVHISLSDGRELLVSPRHPTADGRLIGDLNVGDILDGARVTLIEQIDYDETATYDLLPSGGTGLYWANGILIGTTLMR